MKVLGSVHVKVSELFIPGGWDPLTLSAQAIELAHSIKRIGMLEDPIVRKSDMRVLTGRHRVAATMINLVKTIRVKLVECTDLEAQIAGATADAVRRHDPAERAELMLRLVDLYEQQSIEEDASREEPVQSGEIRISARPRKKKRADPKPRRTPRSRARAQVAKEFGVTEREVRRKEQQANEPDPVGHIDLIGMTVGTEFLKQVGFIQHRHRRAVQHLKSAQAELTRLRNAEAGFPEGRLQRESQSVHDATALVLSMVPSSICPYCKGLTGLIEKCATCLAAGYVGESIVAQAPKELLDEKEIAVAVDGKMVPLEDFLASQPSPWE